jgi:galactose-1-phosphate uridylyltransferase
MADGTIKQVNPFTGTQVWTIPGRGHHPLGVPVSAPLPIDPDVEGRHCALCHLRYLETPPEKARLVRVSGGEAGAPGAGRLADGVDAYGASWRTRPDVPAEGLYDDVAEFRRIPNLFEILSFDYWRANYAYKLPAAQTAAMRAYLAAPAGREHVLSVVRTQLATRGLHAEWAAMSEDERLEPALAFFGGTHELIVARRHFRDGAEDDDALASSGSLTPEEHYRYTAFTVEALRSIYDANGNVRYVAVFQNWLKPGGTSLDHLHKQLAGIDEYGHQVDSMLERLLESPSSHNELVNYAGDQNLVVAENDHAVALVGFGHRYPTLEVFSKSVHSEPWEHEPEELRGISDLLHACHAATGPEVPCNEEWHHRPIDVDAPMPWRIVLKWRGRFLPNDANVVVGVASLPLLHELCRAVVAEA